MQLSDGRAIFLEQLGEQHLSPFRCRSIIRSRHPFAARLYCPVVEALAERTLGYGTANAERLNAPINESAILVWQGVLEDKNDIARVSYRSRWNG
jgi:hypothetical protein